MPWSRTSVYAPRGQIRVRLVLLASMKLVIAFCCGGTNEPFHSTTDTRCAWRNEMNKRICKSVCGDRVSKALLCRGSRRETADAARLLPYCNRDPALKRHLFRIIFVISTETNGVSEAEKSQLKNNVRKANLVRRLRATTFAATAGST